MSCSIHDNVVHKIQTSPNKKDHKKNTFVTDESFACIYSQLRVKQVTPNTRGKM